MSDLLINSSSSQNSTYSTGLSSSSTSSAASASSTGNVLRLNGMATGLDVDSIVSSMMKPYQVKIDEVNQSIQKVEWKQQMYDKIISDIKDLQNTYFNVADPDNNIASASFFNCMTAASDSSSVAVSADSTAQAGTYSISVGNLAAAALVGGNSLSSQVQVTDLKNWVSGGKIDFTAGSNSGEIQLKGGYSSVDDLVADINSKISGTPALSGSISASYYNDGTNNYIKFTSTDSGAGITSASGTEISVPLNIVSVNSNTTLSQLAAAKSTPITLNSGDSIEIAYNGMNYKVKMSKTDGSETLGQLAADISNATSGKVTAGLDDITGKFEIQSSISGSSSTLSVSAVNGDSVLQALNITDTNTHSGTDAVVAIENNGATTMVSESSNNFTLNGITYKVSKPNSPANITVSSDANNVVTKFKGFMDKYNSVVSEIKDKLTEKVDYNYPPLTSAQEKEMSQTQIDSWNQKAQQGLLSNDSNLENLLQDLKDTFYNAVYGASAVFGPKTTGLDLSGDYAKDGQIVFSDSTGDQFKQVIEGNPSSIASLFTQPAPSGLEGENRTNNEGIAQRINDILVSNTGMAGVVSDSSILGAMAYKQDDYSAYASSGTDTFLDQIYGYNLQINDLQTEYNTRQTQYYNEFTNLEQAMEQLDSQSSFLTQMMGGSTGA